MWGLPGAPPLPAEPLADDEFGRLRNECEVHRLIGLLAVAMEAGDFAVTDEQWAEFVPQVRMWQAVQLRHEQLLLRAATALHDAGIDLRVLKGVALARLAYPRPEWRTFGDVDVLVPSHQFHRAAEVLSTALPGGRALPEPFPGFDDRYGREILVRSGELECDLHRTFISGYYGLVIPVAELFASSEAIVLAGRELPALSAVHRLLHSAIAAAVGDMQPRLSAARDLVQLLSLATDEQAAEVIGTAARWRCTSLVAAGVATVSDWPGEPRSTLLGEWAAAHRPGLGSRLLQRAYHSGYRGPLVSASGVLAPLGPLGRVRYAVGITRQTLVSLRQRRS